MTHAGARSAERLSDRRAEQVCPICTHLYTLPRSGALSLSLSLLWLTAPTLCRLKEAVKVEKCKNGSQCTERKFYFFIFSTVTASLKDPGRKCRLLLWKLNRLRHDLNLPTSPCLGASSATREVTLMITKNLGDWLFVSICN